VVNNYFNCQKNLDVVSQSLATLNGEGICSLDDDQKKITKLFFSLDTSQRMCYIEFVRGGEVQGGFSGFFYRFTFPLYLLCTTLIYFIDNITPYIIQ
jgi:hypothetical protein